MTPKEKAEELMNMFLENINADVSLNFKRTLYNYTKKCLLNAVDVIIAQIEPSVSMDVISARIKYWQEVKEEIEKL